MHKSSEIYRLWSPHPRAANPVASTTQDESVVASIAEHFPEVIYFFSDERI